MTLTRVRTDELANVWAGDEDTPFQIALLGVLDAVPIMPPDDTVDARTHFPAEPSGRSHPSSAGCRVAAESRTSRSSGRSWRTPRREAGRW